MPAPNTLNARIAIAKGWTWQDCKWFAWHDSKGRLGEPPDFVGTLAGLAGLMRELNEHAKKDRQYWWWSQNAYHLVDAPRDAFICVRHGLYADAHFLVPWFWSPDDRPGDCVGKAWLSEIGEETDDASRA